MKISLLTFAIFLLSIINIDAVKISNHDLPVSACHLADSFRLQTLEKSAMEHVIQNIDKTYIDALLGEAQKQHNNKYIGKAYFLYAEIYYNINYDSMRYYIRKGEPFLLKSGMYEEAFRMRGWNIYSLVNEGRNELVLPEVQAMIALARKIHYPNGEEIANHALANFYLNTGMQEEGIRLYNESLVHMTKRGAPIKRRIYVLRQLINKDNNTVRHFKHLKTWNSYIEECESKGIYKIDEIYTVDVMRIIYYHCLCLSAYEKKNAGNMLQYLLLSGKIIKDKNLVNEINGLNDLWIKYYLLTKNPEKGLAICEQQLNTYQKSHMGVEYSGTLEAKSQLLMMTEKKAEALKCYQQFVKITDSLRTTAFYQSLKSLDNQRKFDQLELKNKQLKLASSRYHYKMMIMKYDFTILAMICILMIVIIIYARRGFVESKKAQFKAEEADQIKSAFLANINHEIRTPLNAIVGFSQLIVDEKDSEARKQYSEIILSNNEKLQQLIGDVLDLSKIESNSVKISFSSIDLLSLMETIYYSILPKIPTGVTLQMKSCHNFIIYSDPLCLTQIITHLLKHAIQNTHKGYIRFGYQMKENKILFSVEDTSEGIPKDKISTVFEYSYQFNQWSNTDLSLAICKGLTMLLGGSISLESTLGKGSTFFVTLPVNKKEEENKNKT
ncbi:MAG: HAMP domain-containing histidine kinase [Bacteroidaceae bacterium]|nr:HAMP domain-containing histidine kinase [Bacteroidaceae bacterium]